MLVPTTRRRWLPVAEAEDVYMENNEKKAYTQNTSSIFALFDCCQLKGTLSPTSCVYSSVFSTICSRQIKSAKIETSSTTEIDKLRELAKLNGHEEGLETVLHLITRHQGGKRFGKGSISYSSIDGD